MKLKKTISITELPHLGSFSEKDVEKFGIAAWTNDFAIISDYLAKGIDVNKANHYGNTALLLASCNGNLQIVKQLIQHNANLNHANQNGDTSLIWAADKGHVQIVEILIEHHADSMISNHNGHTALFWAKHNGHKEIILILEKALVHQHRRNEKTVFISAS